MSALGPSFDPVSTAAGIPTPEEMVEARRHVGGTAKAQILDRIEQAESFLNNPE